MALYCIMHTSVGGSGRSKALITALCALNAIATGMLTGFAWQAPKVVHDPNKVTLHLEADNCTYRKLLKCCNYERRGVPVDSIVASEEEGSNPGRTELFFQKFRTCLFPSTGVAALCVC